MTKERKVELLAPAGDLECIKAAINAGADAVYTGGEKFGARAFAENLNREQLIEAINYAHIHGSYLYLTINTLLKNDEIKNELFEYLNPLYLAGLDAVIVQDMGVFKFINDNFKNLDIHVSTQSTINGKRTAKRWQEMGASRIVTPRELSLEAIKDIHEYTDVEIESFVHGALCYCYSGMCLLSSIVGSRSGNRGRCAQPCRKTYTYDNKTAYLLSTKDMCTIKILPEIIRSGVYSLKIEGRMKKPLYVAGVVSIYRKYLDFYLDHKSEIDEGKIEYTVSDEDYNRLFDLFNRNGFNESYYKTHCDKSMMSLEKPSFRTENKEFAEYINDSFIKNEIRELIDIDISIKKDSAISANVTLKRKYCEDVVINYSGITPSPAMNRAVTKDEVIKQLSKLGNTPFILDKIDVTLDEGLFLSVGMLKDIKRDITLMLQEKVYNEFMFGREENIKCTEEIRNNSLKNDGNISKVKVLVNSFNQLEKLSELDFEFDVYVEDFVINDYVRFAKILKKIHDRNKKVYFACIRFLHFEKEKLFKDCICKLVDLGIDGFLIRSFEELSILKEMNIEKSIILDNTVYLFNDYSFKMLDDFIDYDVDAMTYPYELKNSQISHLANNNNMEFIVYGRMPVMISANCIVRNTKGCSKCNERLYLKDELSNRFFVITNCNYCQNVIYNSVPTSLYGISDKWMDLNFSSIRLDFTDETVEEMCDIIEHYYNLIINGKSDDNVSFENNNFTRGHFLKGVK